MTSRMAAHAAEAQMIARLKDQMLIVLLKRVADENGEFRINVEEVDETQQDLLEFECDQVAQEFIFKLSKKS